MADAIAALERLGPFTLGPPEPLRIRDRYLDTPAGALSERRIALRIREQEEEVLIALKGDARPLEGGGVDRLELEQRASSRGLATILQAISDRGVPLPGPPPRDREGDPTPALVEGGWRVVQDRETLRRRKDVTERAGDEPVAELVVDSTLFRPGGAAARHHEVEIESGGPGGAAAVRAMRARLLESFQDTLQPWDHPKLATGFAVQRLLTSGDPGALLGPDGDLRPGAYDLLRAWLEEGEEPDGPG